MSACKPMCVCVCVCVCVCIKVCLALFSYIQKDDYMWELQRAITILRRKVKMHDHVFVSKIHLLNARKEDRECSPLSLAKFLVDVVNRMPTILSMDICEFHPPPRFLIAEGNYCMLHCMFSTVAYCTCLTLKLCLCVGFSCVTI